MSKNILWRKIETERLSEYTALINDLETAGVQFSSFVIDGRTGVRDLLCKRFPDNPLQLCQFHQVAIVKRYLTSRPKTEAGQELLTLTMKIKKSDADTFTKSLNTWHEKHATFLAERSKDDSKRGWHYTHKRLRSAYRSLRANLPWLFTYLRHPHIGMPNTTNSCDGSFAHLKQKVKLHRGLRKHRRDKMVNYFLEKG